MKKLFLPLILFLFIPLALALGTPSYTSHSYTSDFYMKYSGTDFCLYDGSNCVNLSKPVATCSGTAGTNFTYYNGSSFLCASPNSGSGDITSVQGDNFITNGSDTGDVFFSFNTTRLPVVLGNWSDDRANYVNKTFLYSQVNSFYTWRLGNTVVGNNSQLTAGYGVTYEGLVIGVDNATLDARYTNVVNNRSGLLNSSSQVYLAINTSNVSIGARPVVWINPSLNRTGFNTNVPGNTVEVNGTLNATTLQQGVTSVCLGDGTNCVGTKNGTVTSVASSNYITGGTITSTGTLSFDSAGFTTANGNWSSDRASYVNFTILNQQNNLTLAQIIANIQNWSQDRANYINYTILNQQNNLTLAQIAANIGNDSAIRNQICYSNGSNCQGVTNGTGGSSSGMTSFNINLSNNTGSLVVNNSQEYYLNTSGVLLSYNAHNWTWGVDMNYIGLFFTNGTGGGAGTTAMWLTNLTASGIGNWSADKSSYSTAATADARYYWTTNGTFGTSAMWLTNLTASGIGNWSADKSSYSTTAAGDQRWLNLNSGGWINSSSRRLVLANNNTNISIGNVSGLESIVFFDNTNGRVGIGNVTSPGALLDVAGTVNVTTLQTSGTTRISSTGVGTFATGTTVNSKAICLSDGTGCQGLQNGTVTSIASSNYLTGGTITTTGTLSVDTAGLLTAFGNWTSDRTNYINATIFNSIGNWSADKSAYLQNQTVANFSRVHINGTTNSVIGNSTCINISVNSGAAQLLIGC